DQHLTGLQQDLTGQVLAGGLPLIGASDGTSAAAGVIDAFRSALLNSLAAGDPDEVRQALLDQLGPNGLAVLRDQDGDGSVDLADIPLLSDATTVSYDIHLRSDASATSSFHLR